MLTNLPTSDRKYELTTHGNTTKLISQVPLTVNDRCFDGKRDRHVLSVSFGTDKKQLALQLLFQ